DRIADAVMADLAALQRGGGGGEAKGGGADRQRPRQDAARRQSSRSRRTASCANSLRVSSMRSKVSSIWNRSSGTNLSVSFLPMIRRNSPLLRASSLSASSLPWPPSGSA